MNRSLLASLAVIVLCTVFPGLGLAETIGKLDLDDASKLLTRVETDSKVKCEGKASVKISTRSATLICLGELSGLSVEAARLRYRARVRCENLEGTAYLEMWCTVKGLNYFSRGINSVVTKTMDWTSIETPFLLQAGQKAEKVTLNLVVNGRGTVWVDDASLEKQPLK